MLISRMRVTSIYVFVYSSLRKDTIRSSRNHKVAASHEMQWSREADRCVSICNRHFLLVHDVSVTLAGVTGTEGQRLSSRGVSKVADGTGCNNDSVSVGRNLGHGTDGALQKARGTERARYRKVCSRG